MNDILTAIRSALVADSTLLALVPAVDITTTYNKESANYPCMVFSVSHGGAYEGSTSLQKATIVFSAYSRTSKLAAMQIISRVRTLFNNLPNNVSDASIYVHVSVETDMADTYYERDDTWLVTATYEMLYAGSSYAAYSIASGSIYADATNVTAVAGKKIADFSGPVRYEVLFEKVLKSGQNRFHNGAFYKAGIAKVTLQKVAFLPASMYTIWSITRNAADTLADGSTTATSYKVTQSSQPNSLQFLFHGVRSDNGKQVEIRANKAYCESIVVPFGSTSVTVYDVTWLCLADSADNVIAIAEEN